MEFKDLGVCAGASKYLGWSQQRRELHDVAAILHQQAEAFDGTTSAPDLADTLRFLDPFSVATKPLRKSMQLKSLERHIVGTVSPPRPLFMLDPEGLLRTTWDFLASLQIVYILFRIPWNIAFSNNADACPFIVIPVPGSTTASDYTPVMLLWDISLVFFSVDIFLNFITGIVTERDGEPMVSYDLHRIGVRYLSTWLTLDLLAVVPLDCILLVSGVDEYSWALGAAQALRLLRVFTFTRRLHGDPLRFLNLVAGMSQRFTYNLRLLVTALFWMIVIIHYFACFAWIVIRAEDFPPLTWAVQLGLLDAPPMEQWVWCVFNVISAMVGLGYGAYPPITTPEAIFWDVAMLCLCITFAVVNGVIFAVLLSTMRLKQTFKDRVDAVMSVLRARGAPLALRKRVFSYFDAVFRSLEFGVEPELMGILPTSMRAELAHHEMGPDLERGPMMDPQLQEMMAVNCRHKVFPPGEIMTREGLTLSYIGIVRSGYAEVVAGGGVVAVLAPGDWFNKSALLPTLSREELENIISARGIKQAGSEPDGGWVEALCQGYPAPASVVALCTCSVSVLERDVFLKLLSEFPAIFAHLREVAREYVRQLVGRMATAPAPLLAQDLLDDVGVPDGTARHASAERLGPRLLRRNALRRQRRSLPHSKSSLRRGLRGGSPSSPGPAASEARVSFLYGEGVEQQRVGPVGRAGRPMHSPTTDGSHLPHALTEGEEEGSEAGEDTLRDSMRSPQTPQPSSAAGDQRNGNERARRPRGSGGGGAARHGRLHHGLATAGRAVRTSLSTLAHGRHSGPEASGDTYLGLDPGATRDADPELGSPRAAVPQPAQGPSPEPESGYR